MATLEGLDAGDLATADHVQNLLGAGHHPLAIERTRTLDLETGRRDQRSPTPADYKAAARLGTPYKVFENDISPFRIEVAKRMGAVNAAAGLPGDWPGPAPKRAKIRTPRWHASSFGPSTAASRLMPASSRPRSPSTPARGLTPWPATT